MADVANADEEIAPAPTGTTTAEVGTEMSVMTLVSGLAIELEPEIDSDPNPTDPVTEASTDEVTVAMTVTGYTVVPTAAVWVKV